MHNIIIHLHNPRLFVLVYKYFCRSLFHLHVECFSRLLRTVELGPIDEMVGNAIYPWRYITIQWIERLSIECRKTKTKVPVITQANHKGHRQYSEPIKT